MILFWEAQEKMKKYNLMDNVIITDNHLYIILKYVKFIIAIMKALNVGELLAMNIWTQHRRDLMLISKIFSMLLNAYMKLIILYAKYIICYSR